MLLQHEPLSRRAKAVRWFAPKAVLGPKRSLRTRRAAVRVAGLTAPPFALRYRRARLGGVPAITGKLRRGDTGAVVLHVHGGGYFMGTARTFLPMSARLAAGIPANLVTIDYRLAPEHPYPAAVDDVAAAYRALLLEYPASRIAIAGESAGGGAALAALLRLRASGEPMPAAVFLMSPFTDLTASGESISANAGIDPIATLEMIHEGVPLYAGDVPLDDPGLSPLFGDLAGLPPTLIQVGSHEIILSDSIRLGERLEAAGGDVDLEIHEPMWHGFQASAGVMPEATAAIARGSTYLRERLDILRERPAEVTQSAPGRHR